MKRRLFLGAIASAAVVAPTVPVVAPEPVTVVNHMLEYDFARDIVVATRVFSDNTRQITFVPYLWLLKYRDLGEYVIRAETGDGTAWSPLFALIDDLDRQHRPRIA